MVKGNLGKITVKENSIVTDENFFSEVMPLRTV